MTQDPPADEPYAPPAVERTSDPEPGTTADVAFVLPATAYETIVTEADALPPIVATTGTATQGDSGDGPDASGAVRALGERIDQRLDELKSLFQRETRAEAAREKVIDRLHAELQEYKQDLLLNTLRPVFIDLIQLHDDIGKVAVAPAETGGDGQDDSRRLVGLMGGFQQGIEDILYRQGVEPFRVEGDTFDPRRQRAVATVATDDPALNKMVAARLRQGFRAGERVIRPEVVSVFALKK